MAKFWIYAQMSTDSLLQSRLQAFKDLRVAMLVAFFSVSELSLYLQLDLGLCNVLLTATASSDLLCFIDLRSYSLETISA